MSLAIALVAPDHVLLASDSRRWDPLHERPVGDHWKKIDARDGYAILATHCPQPFGVWRDVPIVPGESADGFARRLCAAVPAAPHARESRIAIIRLGPPVDVAVVHVQFTPGGGYEVLAAAHVEPPRGLAIGFEWEGSDVEIPERLAQARAALEAGASEAELVSLAEALLQLGASRTSKIGGPSHFLRLNRDGCRSWSTAAAPATTLATGTGFFLDATSTPTFRVGDPSGGQLKWDGTNLKIVSGSINIDENGVRVEPTTTGSYVTDNGFSFATNDGLSTGPLGMYANDSASLRAVSVQSLWTGVGAPAALQAQLVTQANDTRVGVLANIGAGGTALILESTVGGVVGAGVIDLVGVPNFRGSVSGSAGALAGYINIQHMGTSYKLPVYNP